MKTTFYILIFISTSILALGQTFNPKNVKTIHKYFKYADTLAYEDNKYKWLDEKKEFYLNGLPKTYLHMAIGDNPRDTSYYLKYELNKDSTLKLEREYRSYKSGWWGKSLYKYKKADKNPFEVKSLNFRKKRNVFEYNDKGQLICEKNFGGKKMTSETRFVYDSLNRLYQRISYKFKEGIVDRSFYFNEYKYKQYKDSLVCTMDQYSIYIMDEDLAKNIVIPVQSVNKSIYTQILNNYCVVTSYNNSNEIISENYFNKSNKEENRGQKTLYLRRFYVYDYYK